jgi:hypothetical protein
MAAERERLGKHISRERAYNKWCLLSAQAMLRSYKEDNWGNQISSVWESEENSQ